MAIDADALVKQGAEMVKSELVEDAHASFDARIDARQAGPSTEPVATAKAVIVDDSLDSHLGFIRQDAGLEVVRTDADGVLVAVMLRHRSWPEDLAAARLLAYDGKTASLRKLALAMNPVRVVAPSEIAPISYRGEVVYRVTSASADGVVTQDFYSERKQMLGGLLCSWRRPPNREPLGTCEQQGDDFRFESAAARP